ncbi:MAG: DUF551 domain-containing protein [Eubacterium sp.]|nr:DUF551 domain-containing protein [Eubacterium sp.]
MTREEAINELSVLWERMKRAKESGVLAYKTIMYYDGQYVEALEMAIECLQSSEMWNGTTTDKRIFAPKGMFQKVFEDGKAEPCEDCISRTKLLARIDAERKHLLDIKMDGAEHIVVHHARRIIEDMPSVTPQQTSWIPVSERLPEDYIHVLCQFTLGGMGECYLAHGVFHVVGGLVMTCNEVIAWMPLPERYERGDADADSD